MDASDGGALKDGPVAAEEGDDHKQCHQSVAHQNPLHGHPQHPSLYTLRERERDAPVLALSATCVFWVWVRQLQGNGPDNVARLLSLTFVSDSVSFYDYCFFFL